MQSCQCKPARVPACLHACVPCVPASSRQLGRPDKRLYKVESRTLKIDSHRFSSIEITVVDPEHVKLHIVSSCSSKAFDSCVVTDKTSSIPEREMR